MSREQVVRDVAYAIWEAEGKPEGRAAAHWRLAEEHVSDTLTNPVEPTPADAKPQRTRATASATDPAVDTAPARKTRARKASASKVGPRENS